MTRTHNSTGAEPVALRHLVLLVDAARARRALLQPWARARDGLASAAGGHP